MKHALVTGASGALGACIPRRLAREGLTVYVHGHSHPEHAESVRDTIRAAGGRAEAVVFDVRDGDATRNALEGILAKGPIQVLINNAGIHDDAPLAGMKPVQWSHAAPKAGLHGATKALALELASRGITVNTIAPGIIGGTDSESLFDAETIRRLVPMGRVGRREEVADLVAYLVTGDSGYLSGQIINLNGAMA